MKICWSNLEKLEYKNEKWFDKKSNQYILMISCKNCGNEYFTRKRDVLGDFCDKSCANKGKNNAFYDKKHSKNTRMKMSRNQVKGENHPSWKGGYTSKNIPLYDTYVHQIEYVEQTRRSKEDNNILEVKCAYCGKWYIPKRMDILCRLRALNGGFTNGSEYRLYCSNECKKECPIYRKHKFSAEENNTKQYSREVQPELRQMVFERDKYTCQKCGNIKSLHCHHIEGIRHDPLESADIDKCITLCKKCHKEVHRKEGCKYKDMQCKEITWQ